MTQPEWTALPTTGGAPPAYGPAAASGSTLTPASPWARLIAFVVDFGGTVGLTTLVVFLSLWNTATGDVGFSSSGGNSALASLGFFAIFVIPLASIILNVVLTRTRQYSVGQLLTRTRLVDVRTGGPASVGSIVGRMLLLLVPGFASIAFLSVIARILLDGFSMPGPSIVTLFAPVILAFTIIPMFRGDRRGWQDRATNHCVVAASSRA